MMIARARLDWQNGKPHGSSSNCRDLKVLVLLCVVWVYEAYILKAHRHGWQSD